MSEAVTIPAAYGQGNYGAGFYGVGEPVPMDVAIDVAGDAVLVAGSLPSGITPTVNVGGTDHLADLVGASGRPVIRAHAPGGET